MPRKPKYTKEELLDAAIDIIRNEGESALTARNLVKKLGTAPATIFTHYDSMDDILAATIEKAYSLYDTYAEDGFAMNPPFKGFGMMYVQFAIDEPNLFALLFMRPSTEKRSLEAFVKNEGHMEKLILLCQETFKIDYDKAKTFLYQVWTYSHGLATLCATKVCTFKPEEVAEMLGTQARGQLMQLFAPADSRVGIMPGKDTKIEGPVDTYFK